jgi:lipopolysaccharide export system permease protein
MDPVNEKLQIELVDSEVSWGEAVSAIPGKFQYEINLSDATRKGTKSGHPSELPMRQIPAEMATLRDGIAYTEEILAARAAMGLAIGKYEWLDDQRTHEALRTVSLGKSRITRLNSEPWRRWASGFSCFCFVWVGIPLAIWMRSADYWTSFGACFMPILLVYYPVFAIGMGHAKDGTWPPVSVWMGNALLLLIGAWWMRKINRC